MLENHLMRTKKTFHPYMTGLAFPLAVFIAIFRFWTIPGETETQSVVLFLMAAIMKHYFSKAASRNR